MSSIQRDEVTALSGVMIQAVAPELPIMAESAADAPIIDVPMKLCTFRGPGCMKA